MSRIPTHTLDTAPSEIRPALEHVAHASLAATGRLLNLHGEMAHAPVVLAAYAAIRAATEQYGTRSALVAQ